MKNVSLILITLFVIFMTSCSNSPTDKAQSSVKSWLKENLKDYGNYKTISFSKLDTLFSKYKITHNYSIVNSDKENVKMTISFYLDKDLKVISTNTKNINGDYGTLTGNAYWKYNNYVGNKGDASAEITLYSLDTIRGNLKFKATADVQGNYKIEKILPGRYLLIVRSKNATDCPDSHLRNLRIYGDEIKQLFGFDIEKYKTQLDEIDVLDSLYFKSIRNFPSNGSLSQMTASIAKHDAISKQRAEKIEKLFEVFPDDFKRKIKLYTGYSNAYYFSTIMIEEGKVENIITDFGITCI